MIQAWRYVLPCKVATLRQWSTRMSRGQGHAIQQNSWYLSAESVIEAFYLEAGELHDVFMKPSIGNDYNLSIRYILGQYI